ncbi:MAG TPA: PAS domain-containing protein [Chloroflexota bacterium]|nr:PAS domain-containing protein [Chloroflexota bacterium]
MSTEPLPIDEPTTWPLSLRVAVDICRGLRAPALLCWGPEYRLMAYNEAFARQLGPTRPRLGDPYEVLWPAAWPRMKPRFETALRTGESATYGDLAARYAAGIVQQYDLTCARLLDDGSEPAGVLMTLQDRTPQLVEQRHRERLLRLMTAAGRSLDLEAVIILLLDSLQETVGSDSISLYLHEDHMVRLMGTRGERPPDIRAIPIDDDRLPARAIREGHTVVEDTLAPESAVGGSAPFMSQGRMRSILVVPFLGRRGAFGAVAFTGHAPHPYGKQETRHLEELVEQGGAALENALLYRESITALARLRALFAHGQIGVAIYDASDQFVCLEHNSGFLDLVGEHFRKLGSIVGLPLRDLFDEPSFMAVHAVFEAVRQSGEVVTIDEFPAVLPPDPRPRYYKWRLFPLREEHGDLAYLMVSAVEITELVVGRQQIEELAARAQARADEFEAVIGAIMDGVIVIDAQGSITLVNDAVRRIFGLRATGLISAADFLPVFHLRDPATGQPVPLGQLPGRRALAGETVLNEIRLTCLPGSSRDLWLSVSATPLRATDSTIRGAVITVRDVTLDKELEREKEDFLSVASHELKTPLTSAMGMLQLAGRRLGRGEIERAQAAVREAETQSERLRRLIDDLLNLGRIQSGILTLEREPLNLSELTTAIVSRLRLAHRRHHFYLALPEAPIWVYADSLRIEQVFDNVLGNAVKYSPAGGEVRIDLERAGPSAVTYVRDQGIGIPAGGGKLFERFYRAGNANARNFGGMGVGLWLSRQILEQHGGRIWLENTSPLGSVFAMVLPVLDQPEPSGTLDAR